MAWFRSASRPLIAYSLLATAAIGYAVVAFLLSVARAQPQPEPFLRIPDQSYFFWGTFFYAPVIVGSWLLASGFIYIVAAWAFRCRARFDRLLAATALATGLGTLGTLVPDLLVTSPLRALGVIGERAWEESIRAQNGGWFVFTWITLIVYLGLFLVAYPLAVRQTTKLSWWRSIAAGGLGFAVFQGIEYVFIR